MPVTSGAASLSLPLPTQGALQAEAEEVLALETEGDDFFRTSSAGGAEEPRAALQQQQQEADGAAIRGRGGPSADRSRAGHKGWLSGVMLTAAALLVAGVLLVLLSLQRRVNGGGCEGGAEV